MDKSSDIDAWRRVHRQLTLALMQSRDNIAAERTKRRYLLEEMNRWRVQNAPNVTPGVRLKAKKKAAPKKAAVTVKKAQPGKSKKAPSTAEAVAAKTAVLAKAAAKKSKAKVTAAAGGDALSDKKKESSTQSGASAGGDAPHTDLHHAAGMALLQMGQSHIQPSASGAFGSNVGLATPSQMDLAFQLMQQMNPNAATPGGGKEGEGDADANSETSV